MTMWSPERVMRFREKLIGEMTGHQLWYHPTKEKNRNIMVVHPECPYADKNTGKVPEHRYIWWLNNPDKKIKYNEMIHHINGDHQDNRIENLMKVKRKLHGQLHEELKKSIESN